MPESRAFHNYFFLKFERAVLWPTSFAPSASTSSTTTILRALSLVVPPLLLVQARELGSVRVTRNNSQGGERMGEKTVKVSGKRIASVIDSIRSASIMRCPSILKKDYR